MSLKCAAKRQSGDWGKPIALAGGVHPCLELTILIEDGLEVFFGWFSCFGSAHVDGGCVQHIFDV